MGFVVVRRMGTAALRLMVIKISEIPFLAPRQCAPAMLGRGGVFKVVISGSKICRNFHENFDRLEVYGKSLQESYGAEIDVNSSLNVSLNICRADFRDSF